MFEFKRLRSRGSDRLGLVMIVASLLAITLLVGALRWQQKSSQEVQIREQGISLTRMLSGLPYAQLVAPAGQQGLLSTIFQSQNDPDFAYIAIINKDSQPVSVAAAPGVTVPSLDWPERTGGWLSERTVITSNGDSIIEFYAPLYADDAIAAYLRLGYTLPGMSISLEQLPFFATLALIVFLLTPLFYFLLRHEIRPLRQANEKISALIESEQFRSIEIGATGQLSDFIERFTAFVDFAKKRIDMLEVERDQLVTSKNLITYSKVRIENVLEAIPEAVLILDESGEISFANRRIGSLLGVAHDEVINGDLSDWCDNSELLETISRYSRQSGSSYLSETVRLDVGGKNRKNITIKAYPLFSPMDSTNIYGTLIVLRDVTKEAAGQRTQGEFVAHVAHELKTPLNTLSLCTESLLDDGGEDPQGRVEAVNMMRDEVERLAGLIDNLLSITKIEMGQISVEKQRLRLHDFLEDTFSVASRGEKAKELTFELDLPSDLTSIMADKDLLRIAINNLLTNAVKYSQPGGTVGMSCEESDQTVRICVRDEGIGIAPDEQVRIFDRFYRSADAEARQRTGHGLGLALARDIVQLHYGTLTVTSTPGEGSEFVIEIWKDAGLLKQVI